MKLAGRTLYRVCHKELPIEKTVLLKNDTTYRLKNFKVYEEMYSNQTICINSDISALSLDDEPET